jgi:hypothetical protein
MMRIEELTADAEADHRGFVLRDARSLIYCSSTFRNFLQSAVGGEAKCLLAMDGNGHIVGALPFFRHDSPVGSVINSLPWYGSHGGCTVSGPDAAEARRELLKRFRMHVNAPDVLSATMVLTPFEEDFVDEYRQILSPSAYDHRIGQMTALPNGNGNLLKCLEGAILQKTRNLVRKSLKQGFVLASRDDERAWKFLYDTHVENMLSIGGKPKPWAHFLALREVMPAGTRRLLIAELDSLPVAGLLLLYFNKTVEYITPVSKHDYRSCQPLSFLIWQGMLDAIERGYQWWNWGGTWQSQGSLHHFKAGWGAQDMPYSYLICASADGRAKLSSHRDKLAELFPYYYTYPYAQL